MEDAIQAIQFEVGETIESGGDGGGSSGKNCDRILF